eukprot:g2078.t1
MSKKIVAIDLGTSRTAYAFSVQGRAEQDVIVRIPDGSLRSVSAVKTDTAILLASEAPHEVLAFGRRAYERFVEYVAEAEDGESSEHMDENRNNVTTVRAASGATTMLFRWFKMELCERRGYQSVDDPEATAEGGGKLPLIDVMTASLRHIKGDVIAHLSSVSGVAQTIEDVAWVVTIPAIYDDFAKRFMRVAAHKAGITSTVDSPSLQLCLEPEAACLAVTSKSASHLAEAGTKIMVLDCGGGTVDITTHEVISTSPMRLKELLPPTGGPWGSTCVDREFLKWCKGFLGETRYAEVRRTREFCTLLTQWEEGKTRFGGGEDGRVRLNMAALSVVLGLEEQGMQALRSSHNDDPALAPELHVTGSKFLVVLPSKLVTSFFAPTIKDIEVCLRDLKRQEPLADLRQVFLVGGFSSSPLIQAVARAELAGGGCEVVLAERPGVAIVRGGVLFANNAETFSTRKARLSYGMRVKSVYDPEDPEHVRRRPEFPFVGSDGRERISTFSCHVGFGEDIPAGGACRKRTYKPVSALQSIVTLEMLASHEKNVRFPDKESTFTLGLFTVPLNMSANFENRGVEVQFVFGGTELSVTCTHLMTGEKVGGAVLSLVQEVEEAG